jgi:flagellar biosynthesis anti-sigma factor FlgM
MGKLNIDKANGFRPVRTERIADLKRAADPAFAPPENTREVNADRLDLSERASEVGRLVEKVKEMPDIRQEKVKALRERVLAGDYDPSSDEIAAAILKDERS